MADKAERERIAEKNNAVKIKVNVDTTDIDSFSDNLDGVISGMKTLKRELRETIQLMRELQNVSDGSQLELQELGDCKLVRVKDGDK